MIAMEQRKRKWSKQEDEEVCKEHVGCGRGRMHSSLIVLIVILLAIHFSLATPSLFLSPFVSFVPSSLSTASAVLKLLVLC